MKRVPGTRDLLTYKTYTSCYEDLRKAFKAYNFKEIHTPLFEEEEVFLKNIGEETDVINKEIYYVADKHNTTTKKKVLRPELTAPIMRAFFENSVQETPWQVFQIGEAFRHERPQKGRYREFFQCSVESINASSEGHDIALLSMLYSFFTNFIEVPFTLEINCIGSQEERNFYKKELFLFCQQNQELNEYLSTYALSEKSILKILDTKNEAIKVLLKSAPEIKDFLSKESKEQWATITTNLSLLDIPFVINPHLVRGLDYYNGLVFEFTSDSLGAQNAFCGGGRYDYLANNFSSKKVSVPALGAGIGIDRIILLKKENQEKEPKKVAIIFAEEDKSALFAYAITLQRLLSCESIISEIFFDKDSLKSSLKKAHNKDFFFSLLLTNNDHTNQTVTIKYMHKSKEQISCGVTEIVSNIKKYL